MTVPAATEQQPPRLRRLPVPLVQPRPALRVVHDDDDRVTSSQGTLALSMPAPPPGVRAAAARAHGAAATAQSGIPEDPLPEPHRWAAQFVQAAIEVAAGVRPATQLVRWTTDDVRAMLTRRGNLARRTSSSHGRPRRTAVRSARVFQPRAGVVEASALVSEGGRLRAVALRMEGIDGRWRVTALEIG